MSMPSARGTATVIGSCLFLVAGPTRAQEEGAAAPPVLAAAAKEGPALKLFQFRHVTIDQNLEQLLSRVLNGFGPVAVDRSRNQVAVQCSSERLPAIEAFFAELDRAVVPSEPSEPREDAEPQRGQRVRFVWLATEIEGAAPPEKLGPVLEELGQVGITDLRLVSQTVIRAVDRFTITAYPEIGGQPASLQLQGEIRSDRARGASKVEISASASAGSPSRGRGDALASVNASLLVRPGQPTLLSAHEVGKMTSVFILEIDPSP